MANRKFLMAAGMVAIIVAVHSAGCLAATAVDDAAIGAIDALLPAQQEIVLLAGTSRVLVIPGVQRVQVASPAIADVVVASAQEIVINGITSGITTLHIWTNDHITSYNIRVVSDMVGVVQDMLRILNDPDIKITSYKDTILILSGTVASPARKERAVNLAKAFSNAVVDLIAVAADPVAVAPMDIDLASVASAAIAEPDVTVQKVGKTLFLEGTVKSELARERAQLIAEALAPDVVNLVQVERVIVIRGTTVEQSATVISIKTTTAP